jgi:hypothetical protein
VLCSKQAYSWWDEWNYSQDVSSHADVNRLWLFLNLISDHWWRSNNERLFLYSNIQMIMKLKISQYNIYKNKHKIMKALLENMINQKHCSACTARILTEQKHACYLLSQSKQILICVLSALLHVCLLSCEQDTLSLKLSSQSLLIRSSNSHLTDEKSCSSHS